jgi:hypothetical protein
MLRQSLIAAAFAVATVTASAMPSSAETVNSNAPVHHRTVVRHVYTYEPAPSPYYYGPYYGPAYAPAAPVATLPGAVCLAFSLIGGC